MMSKKLLVAAMFGVLSVALIPQAQAESRFGGLFCHMCQDKCGVGKGEFNPELIWKDLSTVQSTLENVENYFYEDVSFAEKKQSSQDANDIQKVKDSCDRRLHRNNKGNLSTSHVCVVEDALSTLPKILIASCTAPSGEGLKDKNFTSFKEEESFFSMKCEKCDTACTNVTNKAGVEDAWQPDVVSSQVKNLQDDLQYLVRLFTATNSCKSEKKSCLEALKEAETAVGNVLKNACQ